MLATAGALFYVFVVAVLNLCFGFATARYVAGRFKRHDDAVSAAATASLTNPAEGTDPAEQTQEEQAATAESGPDEDADPVEQTQEEQATTAESGPDEDPSTLDAETEPVESASDEAVLEKASSE